MSTVAFLGLGLMGAPMAVNLIRAGHEVTVWNRTQDKAAAFAARHGAAVAATPREAARAAEVVISMVADDDALLSIYRGRHGVASGLAPGAIAIDMSTVSPATVRALHSDLKDRGIAFVDAPVSGSVVAASAGTLLVMAAGEESVVRRIEGILDAVSARIVFLGESGNGASMKLAVNAIVHSLNGAVSEALVLAERAGIARDVAYSVLLESAVAAPFVRYREDSFVRPAEAPVMFQLALAQKDLRLALALAEAVGAPLPQARANAEVLERASEAGYATADETALSEFLRTRD